MFGLSVHLNASSTWFELRKLMISLEIDANDSRRKNCSLAEQLTEQTPTESAG